MGCGNSRGQVNDGPVSGNTQGSSSGKKGDNQQLLAEYTLGEVLGQGAFGVVYACTKKTDKTHKYAVKMVDKVETPVREIEREADMMEELVHDNVVKFHAVYFEKCFVCIVMDRYEGGDLIEGMQTYWKSKGKIPCLKVVHIVRGMTKAICHLHSKQFVHRDVKGDNYLTSIRDITNQNCKVFLSDFGTCVKLKHPNERLNFHCGTKIYWPPEFYASNYALKVDVWALGVIMFGLLDGRFPFKGEQDVKAKHINVPQNTPAECKLFVLGLLEKDESKRFSAAQAVAHPWIAVAENNNISAHPTNSEEPCQAHQSENGMSREGGANAGQDERRKELMERLENAAEKKKPVVTGLNVLWDSRFDVTDKRTGRSWRYEWWNQKRVEETKAPWYLELEDATSVKGQNKGQVDVATMEKMLKEHNIDTSKFGKGEMKTLQQFAEEVHGGAAMLMLDAQHHKKLVRVVDVVLLRITHGDGADKRFLTESSETFADGRSRANLGRLPGTKKEPYENTRKTALRVTRDHLGIDEAKIEFISKENFEEEEMSRSFPGVTTVYRKEIVEGELTLVKPEMLSKVGLRHGGSKSGEDQGFSHTDSQQNTKRFLWLTEAECKDKQVKLRAKADGDEVSAIVQAPIGLTEEELSKLLDDHNIPKAKFGTGGAKSLKQFSEELIKGDSAIQVQADGQVLRIVDFVFLWLTKKGPGDVLVEAQDKNPSTGDKWHRLNRLPGTKLRPDENQFTAAQRVLKRQLKMDENYVDIDASQVKLVEARDRPSQYPGISTLIRKRIIAAELLPPTQPTQG
eukprot:TRINITY_DN48444_c0_g1_i1.p1 TRINITY_DN48444_c0_g1~~TRINITY_DN48444_c0_g1_i1.p1  ORF type:complete len:797 (+),score=169.91 TRINITY_DN48444_c0_g1_i1:100-2490(+)